MLEQDHDVFEEENASANNKEVTQETSEEAASQKGQPGSEGDDSQSGEEINESETPSDKETNNEASSGEKMIPESRFKAALKDMSSKLDTAYQELATLKASPVPDRKEDPDGYDLHVRMETSKTLMREMASDYDEVIHHYKDMADINPYLNQAVASHPAPAKYAYDIAKKDMEIRELSSLKDSDQWKEFQEFRKNKASQEADKVVDKVGQKLASSPTSKVPNLNRATNVTRGARVVQDDDELFAGSL